MNEVNLLGKKEKTTSSSPPGFDSVGQILKYYRELKGLSLEEVSKRTYIKLKYLNSLEENLPNIMPAPVYVYSYIKHYAKLLGLEGGELVKLYQKQSDIYINDSDDEMNPPNGQMFSEKKDKQESKNNNIYLQNKNIIELNSKDINKDNGKTLMDLDAIFDNNILEKQSKTEVNPGYSPIKQENTVFKQQFATELSKQEGKIITQELKDSIVDAERIIREAKNEAERIIRDAQEEAYELRHGAQAYADSVLKLLEQEFSVSLNEIKNGRAFLKNKSL